MLKFIKPKLDEDVTEKPIEENHLHKERRHSSGKKHKKHKKRERDSAWEYPGEEKRHKKDKKHKHHHKHRRSEEVNDEE